LAFILTDHKTKIYFKNLTKTQRSVSLSGRVAQTWRMKLNKKDRRRQNTFNQLIHSAA